MILGRPAARRPACRSAARRCPCRGCRRADRSAAASERSTRSSKSPRLAGAEVPFEVDRKLARRSARRPRRPLAAASSNGTPRPALRPTSKVGTRKAKYGVSGCSRRGEKTRESPRSGCARSVLPSWPGSGATPSPIDSAICTCAQAQIWSAGGNSSAALGELDADRGQRPARRRLRSNSPSASTSSVSHGTRRCVAASGPTRRVAPRKILVVELDEGEVVRLEVGDPVARLGAHDVLRIDADHVARADQLEGRADRARRRRRRRSRVDRHRDGGARCARRPARGSRWRCRAAARAGRCMRRLPSCGPSKSETTCSLPVSSGLPAHDRLHRRIAAVSLRKTVRRRAAAGRRCWPPRSRRCSC